MIHIETVNDLKGQVHKLSNGVVVTITPILDVDGRNSVDDHGFVYIPGYASPIYVVTSDDFQDFLEGLSELNFLDLGEEEIQEVYQEFEMDLFLHGKTVEVTEEELREIQLENEKD